MRVADNWKDYELIDCSCGERLERWGNITLIRPDPQVIWKTEKKNPLWRKADAVYHRSQSGGGSWEIRKKIPEASVTSAECDCDGSEALFYSRLLLAAGYGENFGGCHNV